MSIINLLLIIVGLIGTVKSQSQYSAVTSRIYTDVQYTYPCSRLLTDDGEIGCTSSNGGNPGVIFLIDNDDSLNSYLNDHHTDRLVLALDANYFNKSMIEKLDSKSFEGLLVLTDTQQTYAYSPDSPHPNKKYGLYPQSTYVWNPKGDGLSQMSFNFPMFSLDFNTSVQTRLYGIGNRNGQYPKWGVQLDSFMQAAVDTTTCLRRTFCAPIGGKSTWTSFSPVINQVDPIMMVIVPMDATAMFHDMALGAQSTSYGSAVFLSIIRALSNVDRSTWKMQVIFAIFDGERWGYLGSTKFVNDIINFKCQQYYDGTTNECAIPINQDLSFLNISMANIKYILELNQIGNPLTKNADNQFMFAINQVSTTAPSVLRDTVLQTSTSLPTLSVSTSVSTAPELPPSSTMAFLKQSPSIDHVVITDHFGPYTNLFYQSHNDVVSNVNKGILFDTITLFATVIDRMAGGNNQIIVDQDFTNDIFPCLLESFSCDFVEHLLLIYPYNTYPTYYASVFGSSMLSQYLSIQPNFFHNLMFNLTNSNVSNICQSQDDCTGGSVCIGSMCRTGNTHYHDAISPAFDLSGSSSQFSMVNSSYPSYVESNWDFTRVRFFQVDNLTSEIAFFIAGVVEACASVAVIILIKRYLSKRYKLL